MKTVRITMTGDFTLASSAELNCEVHGEDTQQPDDECFEMTNEEYLVFLAGVQRSIDLIREFVS